MIGRRIIGRAAGAALALLGGVWASSAEAVVMTRTYNFTTLGTIPNSAIGNFPPPTSPVFGSVTVTFDNAVTTTNQTTGITLHALNRPVGAPLGFSYVPALDALTIGGVFGLLNGVAVVRGGTNDVSLVITDPDGPDPGFFSLAFSSTGTPILRVWATTNGDVTLAPEPASLALFGTALLGFGLVRRRMSRR